MPVTNWMPWRSVRLPQVLAAVALVVGVPLFLRSPPWCDITLYQMAARNLLHGGVHYRDLFDTNLPGFVWAMAVLYWLFGPSAVAVRALDLAVVGGIVFLTDRFAKWSGATPAARWWAAAAAALFYPFTVEMAHAQRDTWMLLPGLLALALRVRRAPGGPAVRASVLEGAVWGFGVWMKPHLALMALAAWVLTFRRLAGDGDGHRRRARLDLLGNLAGGLAVGAAGVLWLVGSGAWGPFLDVFTVWNPLYMRLTANEIGWRVEQELFWFPPWSLGLVLTVPLAAASVLDMAPWAKGDAAALGPVGRRLPGWLWDRTAGPAARFARGALGGLYLVWAVQAFLVQRGFQYAHVPETLLMFALWAAHRWGWVVPGVLWLAVGSAVWLATGATPAVATGDAVTRNPEAERLRCWLPRHLLADPHRLRLWPRCWRPDLTAAERYALWDQLHLHPPHEAVIGWGELAEVADYLRAQGAGDGEVLAWFDSPHAVYLMLDVAPAFRFMHVYTAQCIASTSADDAVRGAVMAELAAATRAKFVISDLEWVTLPVPRDDPAIPLLLGPAVSATDLLPAARPFAREFPFNQPTVFRTRAGTGRYIVHRIRTLADDP